MKNTPSEAARPHFRIDWRRLSYEQRPGRLSLGRPGPPRRILDSLDGHFRSGQLSAILGPSGAGKSTFLEALFGSKQERASGSSRVRWYADAQHRRPVSCKGRRLSIVSLPQQDHLLHHLSVYETLMFASKIKNAAKPEATSDSFHRHNVRRIAKMLKLADCLERRCSKLSGGQYKRVSIGQELLSEPDVIILDEPTSGLDAMTCLSTVRTLKSIVRNQPISIILTIHQPEVEVFNLFDHVYVIAQGGLAIYEGPPGAVERTLARAGLKAPTANYNPARFILEQAFVEGQLEEQPEEELVASGWSSEAPESDSNSDSDGSESGCEEPDAKDTQVTPLGGLISRSLLSLSGVLAGAASLEPAANKPAMLDHKPLLNLGVRTLDGKLVSRQQLAADREHSQRLKRRALLNTLNHMQRASYRCPCELGGGASLPAGLPDGPSSASSPTGTKQQQAEVDSLEASTASSDCSEATSSGFASKRGPSMGQLSASDTSASGSTHRSLSVQALEEGAAAAAAAASNAGPQSELAGEQHQFVVLVGEGPNGRVEPGTCARCPPRSGRHFDKRLSANQNQAQAGGAWFRHELLLTRRTWLSIARDPIFFGIQALMHTAIPLLLALIFGHHQLEGCPRVEAFDLVEFAYAGPTGPNMMRQTMASIRQSVGNIGVVFFEMFVICFAINCITALVYPLDMHVLAKEYRNGWYSMRSYFVGRTLADLPLPVFLHSLAIGLLYYMTGQPASAWRFGALVLLVLVASLVAQSLGLTVGALLMKSPQSAVLLAAALVAPIFALSGFIVRIHTLPGFVQAAAQLSYLYHLLNGFIVLRYGFGRCPCRPEDFEPQAAHQIPANLHTLASIWVGTYSNEYPGHGLTPNDTMSSRQLDPNIDVVDKLMSAFKSANSFGHQIDTCDDVLPYPMLDFNLRDHDLYSCSLALLIMLAVSRLITFATIYYKVRSYN